MNWDMLHRAGDIASLLGIILLVWKGNRVLNRIWDVLEQFPPHRHENGLIMYPKGFEPGVVQREPRGRPV